MDAKNRAEGTVLFLVFLNFLKKKQKPFEKPLL